jgi:hypothetical protein
MEEMAIQSVRGMERRWDETKKNKTEWRTRRMMGRV